MKKDVREHKAYRGTSSHGRSTCMIICPFCGRNVKAYIWSLAGSGKKCECGAMHGSRFTYKEISDEVIEQERNPKDSTQPGGVV